MGKRKKALKRKGHCRLCGVAFRGLFQLDDRCSVCLHSVVGAMNRMVQEEKKRRSAALAAPLLSEPINYSESSPLTWV